MKNLSSDMKDVKLGTKRTAQGIGLSKTINRRLDLNASFEKERKEGVRSLSSTIGTSAAITLPEPVDYTNDTLRASTAYAKDGANAQFEYYLSQFTNANASILWDNPFTTAGSPAVARTSLARTALNRTRLSSTPRIINLASQ